MLHLAATDWVYLGASAALIVGVLTWVEVDEWRAQRRWERRRASLPTPQDHAAEAARHAAAATAAAIRGRALVAEAEQAYVDLLRIQRNARAQL